MTLSELVAPESVRTVRRAIESHSAGEHAMTYEVEIVGTSGRRIALEVTSTPVREEGRPAAVQIIGRDITTRRIAEDELRRHSLEDPLTGLPNKTLLRERLEYALSLSKRDGTQVALILIDLDNFKDVNATFGHDAGDAVLRELATRLRAAFREPDTVARLGGDEFAVLAPSLAPGRRPDVIVEQLRAELDAPFERAAGVELTASIGLALAPDHADDVDGLILRADVAMHDAKRSGGARDSTYRPDLDSQSMRRFTLEDELHAAVEEQSFVLHYQPKIDVQTMRTVGVEALLRWPHERLGSVPPSEFIPLAVAMDLMDSITDWVLEQAIRQCSMWNSAGFDIDIAVNLSPNDLLGSTAERIRAQLAAHELPAERLTVEVSERAARQESSHGVLARIASLGAAISIDDFGTGSSSMAHLSRLPIAELKIDRSFVSTVATDHSDRAVARSIIELAHNLGLRAVAEGVETREAYSVIEELGSDQVQGFLVCRPVPANEFESWLRTPAWSSRVR
jgi:diguanylate cyclase (GGDEF)-like protein